MTVRAVGIRKFRKSWLASENPPNNAALARTARARACPRALVPAVATMASVYVDGLSRAMPTLFVAGPAKSGSTFLWECVHQTFHPQHVCGGADATGWSDGACGKHRFVLPPLVADVAKPACLRFQKESSFWRYWGRRPQMTWRRYGGPRLPLTEWELPGRGGCAGSSFKTAAARREKMDRQHGLRAFAGHRMLEDACLQDTACPALGASGRVPYATALPAACKASCTPCMHHPGWMNNFAAACAIPPFRCASATCADAPFVPKALRRANFSGHHARAFSMTAFPALEALATANVSASRLISVEGNPGIFQTPPRHARALASLTTPSGRRALRLIVGLRDPFDLAFSLWSFLSSIGQEGKRVEHRMGRALAAVQACNDSLADDPMRLLTLPPAELESYRLCLDDRPRSRQHFYLYGGLYALHLLGWLHMGYSGEQFLLVRMTSLPRARAQVAPLQRELAAFLGLRAPTAPSGPGVCMSATMITNKRQRLRAHNATVAQVKRAFRASPTAQSLQRFLAGHDALLQALIARERVRVY